MIEDYTSINSSIPDKPASSVDPLVDRAQRLFEFLTRVQELKGTPIRHVASYTREGTVRWLSDLPTDPAVQTARAGVESPISPDSPLLTLERVARLEPPEVPEDLAPWIVGRVDDPDEEPSFRDEILVPVSDGSADTNEDVPPTKSMTLDDNPEIGNRLLDWLGTWSEWAEREREIRPVRDVYDEIFRIHSVMQYAADEWEAVIGICALAWQPEGNAPILRHCFTHELDIEFDDDTGRLTVKQSPNASLTLELDMLDASDWPEHAVVQEIRAACESFSDNVLDVDSIGDVCRRLIHNISGDATYSPTVDPPETRLSAMAAFAPAIIFRKRSRAGMIDILQSIKAQLAESGVVPPGIKILLDPDLADSAVEKYDPADGAWIDDDTDVYLPKPVNDRQLEVIRRVDNRALTVVQGPPGTGKTHTAAVLISHLLAQGKRVLVTAQTDRALKELRGKLPEEIRDLSVSIVGTGREEMAELQASVRKLSQQAAEHSESATEQRLAVLQERINSLRQRKSGIARQMLEAREAETLVHEHGGYRGTLAQIAEVHAMSAGELGWLAAQCDVPTNAAPPLSNSEAVELLGLLRDQELRADEAEARRALPDIDRLPAPAEFAEWVHRIGSAAIDVQEHASSRKHDAYDRIAALPPDQRHELRVRVDRLADQADELARRPERWMSEALYDVRSGKRQQWERREAHVSELIGKVRPILERLGVLADIKVAAADPSSLLPHARAVHDYLSEGRSLKVDSSTGKPKQGMLAPKVVRDAEALFDQVMVDGRPPSTIDQLKKFIDWAEASRYLDALDRAWPADVAIPEEDTLIERLAWHEDEYQLLRTVIDLGRRLLAEEEHLDELAIPRPDWNDLASVRSFARLVDAADGLERFEAAKQPLGVLASEMGAFLYQYDAHPVVDQIRQAAETCDPASYGRGYSELERLVRVRQRADRRNELMARLRAAAPRLADQLQQGAEDELWGRRCSQFEEAWRWADTAGWIRARTNVDVNALQVSYAETENDIRATVTELAAERAWSRAVGRLGLRERADLMQYAQLVQSFGRTGGKYKERKLANIREAMQRCRPAVPVWIMPLYRIAQSIRVESNLFDVVVVDEASQAGLDATFLQYLAPKMVVIGDDKQVSPYGVGVNQAQLQALARQYLYDDRYRASWEEPTRSLFDEARMRFGDLVTLVEHRRCVPDIIGFSNRIAYEPDNIRLIPVREIGTDALEPIRPVFVEGGFNRGGNVNPAEVDEIISQIEKCLADPKYDEMTFGVISLTGGQQAKVIDTELRKRIDPREWEKRDLRCGTAADFQGSERDVMFLSMVATLDDARRYAPLTGTKYVQQFNVAASRAKDQMWLFHSIRPEELTNKEDMRFQLLDYCYGVARRGIERGDGRSNSPVPEDRLVRPFDSLFEQRVHNRIFDRGYVVVPQYESGYRRIDLVIVGARGKLAVECDGDQWHGPESYERDLARQRELERCGWTFFRVRQSDFNIDPAAALAPLWELLEEHGIQPAGSTTSGTPQIHAGSLPSAALETAALSLDDQSNESPVDEVAPSPVGAEHAERPVTRVVGRHARREPPVEAQAAASSFAEEPKEAPVLSDQLPPAHEKRPTGRFVAMSPYVAWDTNVRLEDPKDVRPADRIEALQHIVEVEGPILGSRLYQLYVKSCGRARVGREYRQLLNGATAAATRLGILVESNPLNEVGQSVKTFRLPQQPSVLVRELGPRRLMDVPPEELAAVMRQVRHGFDVDEEEEWFRAVLAEYGLVRLTDNTTAYLRACSTLIGS